MINQAGLNKNVRRNSAHISLNFDPSENSSSVKLTDMAQTYMDEIGLGKQPYLVYQRQDAGHPHLLIVTIKVREDGPWIYTPKPWS
nr:relaxase/mobilization nuclease domain-containing protein [Segetibacter koreensis]